MQSKLASMNDLNLRLKKFLSSQVDSFRPEQPLYEQVSSLDLLTLITRLEKEFAIKFQSSELRVENFSSVEKLATVINIKVNP